MSDVKESTAICNAAVICESARLPRTALLKMSFKQFMACTCGKLVSSLSDSLTSCFARSFKWLTTSLKDGVFAFADRIPVMSAGIPADRLVVETCSLMQINAPW